MFLSTFIVTVSIFSAANAGAYCSDEGLCGLQDYKCIGDQLSKLSDCKAKTEPGEVEEPLFIEEFNFRTPFFNASFRDQGLIIEGFSHCDISGFSKSKSSDAMVLSLDCPDIKIRANRTMYHHKELAEDTVHEFQVKVSYSLLRLTVILDSTNGYDLCTAKTHAFISAVSSMHTQSNDEETQKFIDDDTAGIFRKNRTIFDRDVADHSGDIIMRTFVSTKICDFGCKK